MSAPAARRSELRMSAPAARRFELVLALVALAGIAAWWLWSPPAANDLVGGDEGYYGTMARNVLAGPRWLVSPSQTPLGAPGDKPPLVPALLALSLRAFGPTATALRWPSYLFTLLIALATARVVSRLGGRAAALACVVLLVSLPWLADATRGAGGELPLVAFGSLAVALVVGDPTSRRRAAVAGALLGAAFLCKLWLVAPLALACAAAAFSRRNLAPLRILVVTAVVVAALQLVAVAAFAPHDLRHWLAIDFGFSLAGRAAGGGFAAYWLKPRTFYVVMLVHAFVLFAPLIFAGVEAAWRRRAEPAARALLVTVAGLLPMSLFAVKAGAYVLPILPACVALAALGADALARGRRPALATIVAGVVLTGLALASDVAGPRSAILAWLVPWAAFGVACVLATKRAMWGRAAAAVLVAIAVLGGLVRTHARLVVPYHVTGYRAIAAAIAPRLAAAAPARAALVTPEAPTFDFLLFRTARYWGSPVEPWTAARAAEVRADPSLRVFVVDPTQQLYGSTIDSTTFAWLVDSTTEITNTVNMPKGARPALRVFVR